MTMIETLTSMIFIAWLSGMSYSFTRTALVNARAQETRREIEQATVLAMDVMLRELRMAGFTAAGTALSGIRVARQDRVDVSADLNGDGDTDDANERIAYLYDGSKQTVMRASGGASPQPFVRNVLAAGFELQYCGRDGGTLAVGAAGADPDMRAAIASITVRLRLDLPAVGGLQGASRPVDLVNTVALRNS